jgi:hypothetical protein
VTGKSLAVAGAAGVEAAAASCLAGADAASVSVAASLVGVSIDGSIAAFAGAFRTLSSGGLPGGAGAASAAGTATGVAGRSSSGSKPSSLNLVGLGSSVVGAGSAALHGHNAKNRASPHSRLPRARGRPVRAALRARTLVGIIFTFGYL